MIRRPERRHLAEARSEMAEAVERLVNRWPEVEALVRLAYVGQRAEGRGHGVSDPVGAAVARAHDSEAAQWLDEFRHLRYLLRKLDARSAELLATEGSKPDRPNTVDLCAECGLPAPKVKRIDGQPYHADSCYFRVWRAARRASA